MRTSCTKGTWELSVVSATSLCKSKMISKWKSELKTKKDERSVLWASKGSRWGPRQPLQEAVIFLEFQSWVSYINHNLLLKCGLVFITPEGPGFVQRKYWESRVSPFRSPVIRTVMIWWCTTECSSCASTALRAWCVASHLVPVTLLLKAQS